MTVRSQSRSVVSKAFAPPDALRLQKSGGKSLRSSGSLVTYWPGRSGRLYRLSVFSLIECPAPDHAAYILARSEKGKRKPLHIGAAASRTATLNLAHIRRRGAQLGAHEVLLLAVTGTTADLKRVIRDLRASAR